MQPRSNTPDTRRPLRSPERRPIALALQGGGSHGAFTWGVLDRLLEEPSFEIVGISGTSAGGESTMSCSIWPGWRSILS
jgi:NTE family protein